MSKTRSYYFLFVLLSLVVTGCGGKKLNDRLSLWRNDKIPYGTWYAYNELNYIFPDAEIGINKLSPDRYRGYTTRKAKIYEDAAKYDDKKLLYLVIASDVLPDDEEVTALFSLVGQGKHVFISGLRIGSNLLDSLQLKTAYPSGSHNFSDSLTVSVKNPVSGDSLVFTYPGRAMDNFIVEMDSTITTILGKDQYGRANFVKFDYESGGSISLHLAPIAFTNFFLLHKNNKTYYDYALSHLPKDIEAVRWDDYFRYYERGNERNPSGNTFSALSWIRKQQSLSTALWLLFILLILIYLVESKRKQRIIPVVPVLNNASLDLVKTIGRLYYQRRDNRNLAHKMTAHFMDHVRGKYNIRTSVADAEFEKRLAWKTGQDPAAIHDLLYHIKYIQDQPSVSDAALMGLNKRLENFYRSNT